MKRIVFVFIVLVGNIFLSEADSWTQKNDFAGGSKSSGVSFVISGQGYVGTGDGYSNHDMWEYDPVADAWTQKANTFGSRQFAAAFAINGKGYVGTGVGATYLKDFWEFDP